MSESDDAPGGLETVRKFVNSADLESGSDELGSTEALASWLVEHGLADPSLSLGSGDLERARAVREGLRAVIVAHSGHGSAEAGAAVLDAAARRAGLLAGFGPDGATRLAPTAEGVDAALGRLLALVHGAMADGTWSRLKACADDACQWAFYDHSRNRSGVWCSMAVCGNRSKARAYRERRAGPAPGEARAG